MTGFKLNASGDVEIKSGQIQMIEGDDVIKQRVWCVLSTNKGEWVLNPEQGINFRNILGKRATPAESKGDKALKSYYESRIADIHADNDALVTRLERRLEGN